MIFISLVERESVDYHRPKHVFKENAIMTLYTLSYCIKWSDRDRVQHNHQYLSRLFNIGYPSSYSYV